MTTLTDRPNAALVVIDVQNGVMAAAHERDAVVANIGALVGKARAEDVPVVWVQHSSDDLSRAARLGVRARAAASRVRAVGAQAIWRRLRGHRPRAGAGRRRRRTPGRRRGATDACIRSTIHGAFTRGYDVTLVGDAHTTDDLSEWGAPPPDQVIAHTNLYWEHQAAPGRTAEVTETEDVAFTG